jgi:hypothetical protein
MDTDWVRELERYLTDTYKNLCRSVGESVPASILRINPPLGIDESKYFLSGLQAGIFRLDDKAYVQSELLPPKAKRVTEQRMCQLIWHRPPPPHLFREGVCQLSTASSLILKHGWDTTQVEMEPNTKKHQDLAYGVDILVKSAAERVLICVEVKRSTADLQKLINGFRECCKRGDHAKAECAFGKNHAKYHFCAVYRPAYFWTVAPDKDICFKLLYNDETIELEQIDSLPPRNVIEAN